MERAGRGFSGRIRAGIRARSAGGAGPRLGQALPPSPAGCGSCPAPHSPAGHSANRMSERQARGGPGAGPCICCGGLWGRLDIVLQEKPL